MSLEPTTQNNIGIILPALIAGAGERASMCFLEFFTVNIRNKNTRAAYGHAAGAFLRWCEDRGTTPRGRAAGACGGYIEALGTVRKAPTVKQHLACIRMLVEAIGIEPRRRADHLLRMEA